jgi:hypothetical protein
MGKSTLIKGVILTGAVFSIVTAQNTIDAVSSASGELKLKSGKAYATEAIVVWSDNRSNGPVQCIDWGTTSSYGATLNLKPVTRNVDNTDTLKPLTPSTKYYARFHRTYPSKNVDLSTTFQFTTTAGTRVVPSIERHSLSDAPKAAYISLFSTDGRKIIELPFSGRYINAHDFQGLVIPGLYIAVTSDVHYRQLRSLKVMIGK